MMVKYVGVALENKANYGSESQEPLISCKKAVIQLAKLNYCFLQIIPMQQRNRFALFAPQINILFAPNAELMQYPRQTVSVVR